jgi:hypothetical protein
MTVPTPRVHYTAPKIARRASEILNEPVPVSKIYAWRDAGKIRTHNHGATVCANDHDLVEDLTGKRPPEAFDRTTESPA